MDDITKYFKDESRREYQYRFLFAVAIWIMFCVFSFNMFDNAEKETNLVSDSETYNSLKSMVVFLGVGGSIMGLLMFFGTYNISGISSEFNIFSMKSDVRTKGTMSGSFFLGCGSISGSSEEIDYYVFYKEGRFGLLKDKLRAYDIEVIQTNKVDPSYKEIWVENEVLKFLFVPKKTIMKKIELKT